MDKNKTAIVIGAGISGLATSVFLSRKGFKVTVYEKNPFPGGRCSQVVHDGYRFDMGATIFLMPSVYRSVFDAMGLSLEDSFQLIPLETMYKVFFEDGTEIPFSRQPEIMKPPLEAIESGSYHNLQRYVSTGYELFCLALKKLMDRNFYRWSEFITLKNIGLLIRLKPYIRHMSFIRRFFRDPRLRMAFTYQNIYVGQDPYKAPALFSMIPASELAEGALFPVGGMYRLTQTLMAEAEKYGVIFHFGKPIVRIQTQGNRVSGVVFQDGTTDEAGWIVANADLPYVYRELLPDPAPARRINNLKFGCSAIVIHWGVDKVYPQLRHHSVFLSDNFRENLSWVFRKNSLSDNPSFYIHAPAKTDPTTAPAGGDALSVIIPCGHLTKSGSRSWTEIKEQARKAVINRLKKAGLEDIEEHIRVEFSYTPEDWEKVFNLTRGATFGLGHTIFQMGYFRPHNRHKRYKNLYFTGGNTHPGNGVPLVLLSAKLTSERISKENP